ncbi:hypothetical protein HDU76_011113 [Blyttiomyces sp. JEL0837]|nr:hypothetical protein HDU76_011113 [Blyttiomyces sp. JEL0837]
MFAKFLTLTLALTASVIALPNGAPKCKINPAVITAGHEVAMSTNLGYALAATTTYTPGGAAIPITITGGKPFKGILLYMTKGTVQDSTLAPNGLPDHVGVFQLNAGLRAQTAAACAALNVTNEAPESTLTHAMPLNAQTPYTLMWTPPKTDVGVVTMNVVISVGSEESPWMVVKSIQIQSTGGAGAAGGNVAAPPAPVASPPAPVASPPAPVASPPAPVVSAPAATTKATTTKTKRVRTKAAPTTTAAAEADD